MNEFVAAVAAWWQTRNLYLDSSRERHRRPRESDVYRALAHVWVTSAHVDPNDPLLRAVKAWSDFDADQVNNGSTAEGWRRRKELNEALIGALNAKYDA